MAVDWKAQEKRLRPNVTAEGDDSIVSVVSGSGVDLPADSVIVTRARFDRLLRCAEAAHEWFNAPYDHTAEAGGEIWAAADQELGDAAIAIEPGDLDPLL